MTKSEERATTAGKGLQQLRIEKNISIEDVADETKISTNNIRAIEEEEYEKLPADTFVRGLVTLYGNFLGTDGTKIAAQFLAERGSGSSGFIRREKIITDNHASSLSAKKLAEPSHISSATIALILLAVITLSFTAFCLYTSWNPFASLSRQTENMQLSIQGIFGGDEQQETEEAIDSPPRHDEEQGN